MRSWTANGEMCFECDDLWPQLPEWVLEHWHPSEKAAYPDYFAKREQWKKLRALSWDKEVRPRLALSCHRLDETLRCIMQPIASQIIYWN